MESDNPEAKCGPRRCETGIDGGTQTMTWSLSRLMMMMMSSTLEWNCFFLTSVALLCLSGFAERSIWAFAAGVGVHFVLCSASASCFTYAGCFQDGSCSRCGLARELILHCCGCTICEAGIRISSGTARVAFVSLLLPWSPLLIDLDIAYLHAIQNLQSLWTCIAEEKFCEFQR